VGDAAQLGAIFTKDAMKEQGMQLLAQLAHETDLRTDSTAKELVIGGQIVGANKKHFRDPTSLKSSDSTGELGSESNSIRQRIFSDEGSELESPSKDGGSRHSFDDDEKQASAAVTAGGLHIDANTLTRARELNAGGTILKALRNRRKSVEAAKRARLEGNGGTPLDAKNPAGSKANMG